LFLFLFFFIKFGGEHKLAYTSRTNETLGTTLAYPIQVLVGTGTAGSAVTYDKAFSSTPTVIVTSTATGFSNHYLSSSSATGHTVTAQAAVEYNYIAIGMRE
jgi:hypothetical protein